MKLYFGKDETFCITDEIKAYYCGSGYESLYEGFDEMLITNLYIPIQLNDEQFNYLKVLMNNNLYDSCLRYIYEQFPELVL